MRWLVVFTLSVGVAVSACGGGSADPACTPNEAVQCVCASGLEGVQECNSEGTGYKTGCQCAGESDTTNSDTVASDVQGTDSGGEVSGSDVANDTTEDDIAVDDPCDPDPCTFQQPSCDGYTLEVYEAPTCIPDGDSAMCFHPIDETHCLFEGQSCAEAACVPIDDPADFIFSKSSSVITRLKLATSSGPDACCFDLTGDGEIDNAMGALIASMESLIAGQSTNESLLEKIQSGSWTRILNIVPRRNKLSTNNNLLNTLVIHGLVGRSENGSPADNLTGNGIFSVEPSSFVPGSVLPTIRFVDGSSTYTGNPQGDPSQTWTLQAGSAQWRIPLNLSVLGEGEFLVRSAQIEAVVSIGPNGDGFTFTDGKLGGYVLQEDILSGLNEYVANTCSCLGLGQLDLITPKQGGGYTCTPITDSSCTGDEDVCEQLGETCLLSINVLKPDLDTDGDMEDDAFSIGFWIDATSASLTGVNIATP